MRLYPAIDIIDGKCVRLLQGDYKEVTVFNPNPVDVALDFEKKGARLLHIVDLDGAKKGVGVNSSIIKEMTSKLSIPIELGGGIRSLEDIEKTLSLGVSRVILGSSALKNINLVKEAIQKYGKEKIVVGIDAKQGYVCINGWIEKTDIKALDFAKELEKIGLKYVIYTDISKDGMMEGPNLEETKKMVDNTKLSIIASGGVSCKKDLIDLENINVYGSIIGKALYLNAINFDDIKEIEGR